MTREELDAVRNHISNLPTVGAMYAPVLVEWVSVLLRQRDEVTAQRDNAVDASKEGAWMARALDAERERDELKTRLAHAEADAEQAIHNEAFNERRKIAAWLRALLAHLTLDSRTTMQALDALRTAANAIEQGEHER